MAATGKSEMKTWFTNTLKLPQYFDLFYDEGYEDLSYFDKNITETDIKDVGVTKKGHIKKILGGIVKLHSAKPKSNDDDAKYPSPAPVHKHHGPKKKVSLVFVGETGVGKTTLLKSLEDFINGVKFENVNTTEKPKSMGESQTMDTEQYQLSNSEWAVNIIDTPGIGDTSGAVKDAQHMDNIIDFLGNYGDFNAVCILIKRGTSRLTTRMKYIVNELRSNMPKDVQTNFIVIMTRSDVPVPDKDTMKVIQGLKLPIDNIIPVNNCAYEELDLSEYKHDSPIIKIVKHRQKQDYLSNHNYLQILLEAAVKMTPYQGSKMKALKIKRDHLKERVGLLKLTIDNTFHVEKQINEQIAAFDQAKSDADFNKAFIESNTHIDYEYIKETGKITTHCNACSKACHIGCCLSYGDNLNFCWCAGSNGMCKQCGCSILISHTHLGWKAIATTIQKSVINKDKKLKHMRAEEKKKIILQRKKELKREKRKLEQKRVKSTKEIQTIYSELEKIAIIGYNESFEQYIVECKKAVEKDSGLTMKQKECKISLFQSLLSTFKLMMDAIKGNVKNAANYAAI